MIYPLSSRFARTPVWALGIGRAESTSRSGRRARCRGIMLIELLAYLSVLTVILVVGYGALNRTIKHSSSLRHNTADIALILRVGEQWRSDVRQSTDSPGLESRPEEELLRLPGPQGEVAYRFVTNQLCRRTGDGPWICVLDNIRNSSMRADARSTVTAWRWEVELQPSSRKPERTRPLFTFTAVPNREAKP